MNDPPDELTFRSLISAYSDAAICGDGSAAGSMYADGDTATARSHYFEISGPGEI